MGDAHKVKQFTWPPPACPNLCFASALSWKFSAGKLDFHMALWSVNYCLRWKCLAGVPGLWTRGARAGFGATAGSTATAKICMPTTWCTSRQDSSQVPWYVVLDPTTPTEAFVSEDGCQNVSFWWGSVIADVLLCHNAVTLPQCVSL